MLFGIGFVLSGILLLVIIFLWGENDRLKHRLTAYKTLHDDNVKKRREIATGTSEGPPSHNVEDINVKKLIGESDDPVWRAVYRSQQNGNWTTWLGRRTDLLAAPEHRLYSEFATLILSVPEDEWTRVGIAKAIACMDVVV